MKLLDLFDPRQVLVGRGDLRAESFPQFVPRQTVGGRGIDDGERRDEPPGVADHAHVGDQPARRHHRPSMLAGDMFLPAELIMMSFLRSTTVIKPSASIVAMSPVCNQPSPSMTSAVRTGSAR